MQLLHRSRAERQKRPAPAIATPAYNLRVFFWGMALTLGLLRVWSHRNEMSPDGISYIEIAWRTARFGILRLRIS